MRPSTRTAMRRTGAQHTAAPQRRDLRWPRLSQCHHHRRERSRLGAQDGTRQRRDDRIAESWRAAGPQRRYAIAISAAASASRGRRPSPLARSRRNRPPIRHIARWRHRRKCGAQVAQAAVPRRVLTPMLPAPAQACRVARIACAMLKQDADRRVCKGRIFRTSIGRAPSTRSSTPCRRARSSTCSATTSCLAHPKPSKCLWHFPRRPIRARACSTSRGRRAPRRVMRQAYPPAPPRPRSRRHLPHRQALQHVPPIPSRFRVCQRHRRQRLLHRLARRSSLRHPLHHPLHPPAPVAPVDPGTGMRIETHTARRPANWPI